MADAEVTLRWTGESLRFDGGGPEGEWIRLDGTRETGPAPMHALLLSVAGCMAADIIEILAKMRVSLEGLEMRVEGDRAPEPPRRFLSTRMVCEVQGVAEADAEKLERAVALSKDKYCSVLHTLRPDVELHIEIVMG